MLTCHVLTLFYFLYSKIDGETLDRALSSKPTNLYTVVLFYASWCPFSHGVRANFDVLSSMFPQIRHLAVEQSSAMPRLDDSDAFYLLSVFMYMQIITSIPPSVVQAYGLERFIMCTAT